MALEKEIDTYYKDEILNTLYFGGGTPSLLSPDEFQNIVKHFKLSANSEVTTELNPETVNYDYLKKLYDIGINRISIGCQTFNNEILKSINRRHDSQKVVTAVNAAFSAGFRNISLDFIYGLPDQTEKIFIKDLENAITLGVHHISLYGLSIEQGCHFFNHMPANLPTDEQQADMYLSAVDFLTGHGFEHYEMSNFALPNFYSKHNMNYWNNNEYYGFGAAAHGYINGVRYGNSEILEDYIADPIKFTVERQETKQDKLEEEIFLGLRKMKGINISYLNDKFGINFDIKYHIILSKYLSLGLIIKTPQGYALTPNGVLLSNNILSDFLD